MMRPVITIIFLLCGYFSALSQVTVSAAFDNSKILIGDQAKLHLEASFSSDYQVSGVDLTVLDSIFQEENPNQNISDPSQLEVLKQTEWETLENAGTITYRKDVFVTCWSKGVYFIPQIRFKFSHKGTTISKATNRLTLLVSSPIAEGEAAAIDTTQISPIKDIVEEEWKFSDFLPVIYTLGGIGLALLAIVFLILYLIRKKEGPPPAEIIKRPAYEVALEKLEQLKGQELWQKGEVKAYQSQLTYISREYIENRYNTPALESTTGEILADLKKVAFPESLVEKMREMLQLADMVKFAKANPPEDMHTRLMAYAEEIVQTTKFKTEKELQSEAPEIEATPIAPVIAYAHPGRRILAYLVDTIIFQIIIGIIVFILSFAFTIEPGASLYLPFFIATIASLILGFFYFAYLHAKKRQTPGKYVLGIEVTDEANENLSLGKASVRFLLKFVALLLFPLPFIPIFFTKKRQGIPDMMVKTIVTRKQK